MRCRYETSAWERILRGLKGRKRNRPSRKEGNQMLRERESAEETMRHETTMSSPLLRSRLVVVVPPLRPPSSLLLLTWSIFIITVVARMLVATEVLGSRYRPCRAEALAKAGSENDRAYRSVPSVINQRGHSKTVTIVSVAREDVTHNAFRFRKPQVDVGLVRRECRRTR
jgi:hypothetical protein